MARLRQLQPYGNTIVLMEWTKVAGWAVTTVDTRLLECKMCAYAHKRQWHLSLYTYCDKILSKCKDKRRLLQVKFDLDWSDDFSY